MNYDNTPPPPFDPAVLNNNGFVILKNFIDTDLLAHVHNLCTQAYLNYNFSSSLAGFRMGNLAISATVWHYKLFLWLQRAGLIYYLSQRYPFFSHVSFGGNLNLQGSKKQRIHRDNLIPTLVINIPLSDVAFYKGALSIVPFPFLNVPSTKQFFLEGHSAREVPISTKRGDVILRFSNVWHRGNSNTSCDPDFMLSISLRSDPLRLSVPLASDIDYTSLFSTEFLFGPNIYPSSLSGRLLETLDIHAVIFFYSIV